MRVRVPVVVIAAVTALLSLSGCGGGGGNPTPDEATDPLYQHAKDLENQGRKSEALTEYLHVIDRRGENGAPESHLDAGNLYLNFVHEPFEAYHHFNRFLQLQPNGARADMVRGQLEVAKREAAKILKVPTNDQSVRFGANEEMEALRRRVQELEAENQALHGGQSVPLMQSFGGPQAVPATPAAGPAPMISLDDTNAAGAPTSPANPTAAAPASSGFTRNLPSPSSRPTQVPVARPVATNAPATSYDRTAATPTRPGQPTRPTAPAASGGRRAYTVTGAEKSLWAVARKFYGAHPTSAQVQGIFQANRDQMRSDSDLRPGMELRIP